MNERDKIRAALFGVVSGWCKLRLLNMLIEAWPGMLTRDDVIASLWRPRATPARPRESLRATVDQTNTVLEHAGSRWRVARYDRGAYLMLTETNDA